MTESTPQEMVAQYLALRAHKENAEKALKESLARVYQAMEMLENRLLDHLNTVGGNSLACPTGTVYRRVESSVTIEDREKFLAYLKDNQDFDAIDLKASKSFINELIEKGVDLPPGVKYSSIMKIGVRRPTK